MRPNARAFVLLLGASAARLAIADLGPWGGTGFVDNPQFDCDLYDCDDACLRWVVSTGRIVCRIDWTTATRCEQGANAIVVTKFCEAPPPVPAPTARPVYQPSANPTSQPVPEPTPRPAYAPTKQPTSEPSVALPVYEPTMQPSPRPTAQPTANPTGRPTTPRPTSQPTTAQPTRNPSANPTRAPVLTETPTETPTYPPTDFPTYSPTFQPTQRPTRSPTTSPTPRPTASCDGDFIECCDSSSWSISGNPNLTCEWVKANKPIRCIRPDALANCRATCGNCRPTPKPTREPTAQPSPRPTASPTRQPTSSPTRQPTARPTAEPTTAKPTARPTPGPSPQPSPRPTRAPTRQPTARPTQQPSNAPSPEPSSQPTPLPTADPSPMPTDTPTPDPSAEPTADPSPNPTPVPTFRRDFPYVVLAGVTPKAFGRDPGAAPTFETVVADALPGTSAKHATADPMRRRRLLQADDSARIQFTLFSEAGDGRERLLEALADGTFAAAFDARKGEARSLVGASVDGKRSIEANGEEAPSKKKGSSKKSLAYDLTYVLAGAAAVLGACLVVAAWCVWSKKKDAKPKKRAFSWRPGSQETKEEEDRPRRADAARVLGQDDGGARDGSTRSISFHEEERVSLDPRIVRWLDSASIQSNLGSDAAFAGSLASQPDARGVSIDGAPRPHDGRRFAWDEVGPPRAADDPRMGWATWADADHRRYVRRLRPDGGLELADARDGFEVADANAELRDALGRAERWPTRRRVGEFRRRLNALRTHWRAGRISCEVQRGCVLETCAKELGSLSDAQWRWPFFFKFAGEPGLDAGGLGREVLRLATNDLFGLDMGLFRHATDDAMTYTLSEDATVAEDHDGGLATITFAGKLVAKALLDATHLDAQLNPCLLKHICGAPLGLRDLQDLDWPLYSSLHQLAEIDVTDLCLTFAVESQNYGVVESRELVPGGADKAVTEENKHEFIALRLREGLFEGARANLNAFLRGVYAVIPAELFLLVSSRDLALMLSGTPTIDVDEWVAHTQYRGGFQEKGADHPVVAWFWECLRAMSADRQAQLLQWTTGHARVPVQGFGHLMGRDGVLRKFTLTSIELDAAIYPRAHTCFNRIDVPLFRSKADLVEAFEFVLDLSDDTFTMD
mmetsp:Transcript_21923/g.65705  ORF Transcript_21923/g.65705 Transcript_21923/m.65705 type:complete len:1135 (-) Transcript_21923:106-3510(-)